MISPSTVSPGHVYSILAANSIGGIGQQGKLPWKIPNDLKVFQGHTTNYNKQADKQNTLVLGRKTLETLPTALKDREICVLSRNGVKGLKTFKTVDSVLNANRHNTVFIGGGASSYDEVHQRGLADAIFLTRINSRAGCDTKVDMTSIHKNYEYVAVGKSHATQKCTYDFTVLLNKNLQQDKRDRELARIARLYRPSTGRDSQFIRSLPQGLLKQQANVLYREHEEYQYLEILDDILQTGISSDNRTGVGTWSKWGAVMRYDLRETFPLLTTKRVYWHGVVEELIWFLKGCTDSNILANKKVHIWDGNGSLEFLKSRGITNRRQGDLGPVYGFQWRHFGAKYRDADANYTGEGIDQIAQIIDTIKTNPTDRRILLSAWNPAALKYMALPPCHVLSQFYINTADKEISCAMYQRSGDWGLGIPFNIASYALLTHIIGSMTGYKPAELVTFTANAHVYKNHVEPIREQLTRVPYTFPRVIVKPGIKAIDDITSNHIQLLGYNSHENIKMDLVV